MASSSTNYPAPTSSSSCKYDVFLSFRGEDTRKTFVDHLFSELVRRSIHTYKDDVKLPSGEPIGPSIFKAIEESHIAVIVFSKNYAGSSWCLDELAYIMKCRDEREKIVVPIFYDVIPSDVRKQKGEFGKAFAKQEQKNIIKVESWRKAIIDASNLSGWEPKHLANGHESKGIKKIVDVISQKLFSTSTYVNVDEGLVGMTSRISDMKSRLQVGIPGVRMVGICGIGGSGKTTLATSVYMDICQQFKGCHCIIENIREESSNINGLKDLQNKLLLSVSNKLTEVQSVIMGKREIKKTLCGLKVLILLDDVDDGKQLEALAGSHDWFGDGSRVIITTRDEHLLNKHRVDDVFRASLLSHDESIRLFYKHAYCKNKPVEDYDTLSRRVVSYAAGLPLALIVLGSFLYDKDKNEWMATLARLKDIPETEIVEKLKISYDGLKLAEKELFLDIACFFRRKRKDEAMEILDVCGHHPGIGITVLRQKGLITTLDGIFDMHDLVQEMAFYIVRGARHNNPEEYSRIWRSDEIEELCSGNATTMDNYKIEAIYESLSSHFFKVLSNMKKLRFLSVTTHHDNFNEGPTLLSNELKYIRLSGSFEWSLPLNFQPMKLVILKLDHTLQNHLWNGKQDLPNLRTIELVGLYNLMETPDFDGLPNLERFILQNSPCLKEIHPSFGRLERLVCVHIQGCSYLNWCPPITRSKKLETLVLSGCNVLFKVSDIQQNSTGNLRHVNLESSGTQSIIRASHDHGIKIQYCANLFVTWLITCCSNLDGDTEDQVDVECCIEEPSFIQNTIINHIGFQSFHRGLRKLYLRWCNLVDENMCSNVLEFSNLEELDLRANGFSQLNFSLLQLPRLKWLDVSSCTSLVKLSELPTSIAVLIAENCWSLETLGSISNCKWLWKVSLMGDNKLGLLVGDILLDSMLQGYAIEQHFISFALTDLKLWKEFVRMRLGWSKRFTLQLPQNWHDEFCGFIIITVSTAFKTRITMDIKQYPEKDYQLECPKKVNDAPELDHHSTVYVAYVSFSSLRHTEWLKSENRVLFFSLTSGNECSLIAELVPKRSKLGDPMQRTNVTLDSSEFWDEREDCKTFTIQRLESKSSMNILWRPCYWH
ncbi:TMV resistance protein N-like [Bidens hawaiensis]|uniref:TMV resistance protein N-like n=1 Tax=Bidens hawaiensis TaxID=980011 RepID=UPI00404A6688